MLQHAIGNFECSGKSPRPCGKLYFAEAQQAGAAGEPGQFAACAEHLPTMSQGVVKGSSKVVLATVFSVWFVLQGRSKTR
jgi:hypothetical protein